MSLTLGVCHLLACLAFCPALVKAPAMDVVERGESAHTEVGLRALLRLGQGKRPKTLGHRKNSESFGFRRLSLASMKVSDVPGPAVMLPAPTE